MPRGCGSSCHWAWWCCAACPCWLVFSRFSSVLFPGCREFSKALIRPQAQVTAVFPFDVWGFLTVGLVVAAIVTLALRIRHHRSLLAWFSVVTLVALAVLLLFAGGWALNHYALSLLSDLGLDMGKYSEDELADATSYYLTQAATTASAVPRDGDGTLADQGYAELASIAGVSYESLGTHYSVFAGGSTKPVKPLDIKVGGADTAAAPPAATPLPEGCLPKCTRNAFRVTSAQLALAESALRVHFGRACRVRLSI